MSNETIFTYKVQEDEDTMRLDTLLAKRPEIASRNFAQRLINEDFVKIEDKKINKSFKVASGMVITFSIPDPKEMEVEAQDIDIDIVFEDDDLAVINKPAGLVVHPSVGHWEGTLVNALLFHLKGLSAIGGVKRPGIVHRLDKETSGLMLVAKNDKSHIALSEAIKERRVQRQYLALAQGVFKEKMFSIEAPIARSPVNRKKMAVLTSGRYAKTNAKLITEFRKFSFLQLSLVTGRTHQIRVHMAYINHPLAGDSTYGRPAILSSIGLDRTFLHAYKLGLCHPTTGKRIDFEAPLPSDLQDVLDNLT